MNIHVCIYAFIHTCTRTRVCVSRALRELHHSNTHACTYKYMCIYPHTCTHSHQVPVIYLLVPAFMLLCVFMLMELDDWQVGGSTGSFQVATVSSLVLHSRMPGSGLLGADAPKLPNTGFQICPTHVKALNIHCFSQKPRGATSTDTKNSVRTRPLRPLILVHFQPAWISPIIYVTCPPIADLFRSLSIISRKPKP